MRATPKEKASLRIGNTIAEMRKVAKFVEAFGKAHGLAGTVVNDVNLCLDELLNNTISYGYQDEGRHSILISLHIDGQALLAELQDDAKAFDPRRSRSRRRSGDRGRRRAGGLGLQFVNALMDEVDYVRTDEYNQVRLKKILRRTGVLARKPRKRKQGKMS
jgi:anti-sigma regulatory factor (Ser/Thr protein kinase)